MSAGTQLYRHFDAAGTLLYVGISCSFPVRTQQHKSDSIWFGQIATVKIEHFPTRDEALAAEIEAIKKEKPLHNAAHRAAMVAEAMPLTDNKVKYKTTLEWLMAQIDGFLKVNSHLTPEQFGWAAIRDSSLIKRLRSGGDCTTRKLDALIRYMSNPKRK